ncbi:hypothetical protein [Salinigranum sp. GCM10025319]|uniref:hypothetical protein n=1 Tax=Salinigranum sp. GCM10025319 TaxID=3252687 RepID=UPI0036189CD4
MKYIYLDLNSWINLHMREEDDDLRRKIERAVADGDVAIPLIHTLLREEATFENEEMRSSMFNYMFDLSKTHCLRTFEDVRYFEVERFVYMIQGIDWDLNEVVRGQGVGHMFGNWTLTVDGEALSREDYPDLYDKIERLMVEKPGFDIATDVAVDLARNQESWEQELHEEVIEITEEWDEKFHDNARRRRYAIFKHFQQSVFPELMREMIRQNTFHDFSHYDFEKYVKQGDEEVNALFQLFPATYSYIMLTNARDLQDGRKPNDVYDLFSLGLAIPYTDVVVTEKFWSHEASRAGLDERYSTDVLSSLDEIPDAVDAL